MDFGVFLREGAARVLPRLTYRHPDGTTSASPTTPGSQVSQSQVTEPQDESSSIKLEPLKRSPHLRLQRRLSSSASDVTSVSIASNEPAIAVPDDYEVSDTDSTPTPSIKDLPSVMAGSAASRNYQPLTCSPQQPPLLQQQLQHQQQTPPHSYYSSPHSQHSQMYSHPQQQLQYPPQHQQHKQYQQYPPYAQYPPTSPQYMMAPPPLPMMQLPPLPPSTYAGSDFSQPPYLMQASPMQLQRPQETPRSSTMPPQGLALPPPPPQGSQFSHMSPPHSPQYQYHRPAYYPPSPAGSVMDSVVGSTITNHSTARSHSQSRSSYASQVQSQSSQASRPSFASPSATHSTVLSPQQKKVTFDRFDNDDNSSCASGTTQATSVDDDYVPQKGSPKQTVAQTVQNFQTLRRRAKSMSAMSVASSTLKDDLDNAARPRRQSIERDARQRERSPSRSRSLSRSPLQHAHSMSRDQSNDSRVSHHGKRDHDDASLASSHSRDARGDEHSDVASHHSHVTGRSHTSERSMLKLESVQADLREQQRAKSSLEIMVQTLEANVERLQLELNTTSAELDDANQALEDSQLALSNTNRQRDDVGAALEQEKAVFNGIRATLQQEKAVTSDLRAALQKEESVTSELKASLTAEAVVVAGLRASLEKETKAAIEVRLALVEEEGCHAKTREERDAFNKQSRTLEERCRGLEEQVEAARHANKELHVLMSNQIDDLTATKTALQKNVELMEVNLDEKKDAISTLTTENTTLRNDLAAIKTELNAKLVELEALAADKTALDETVISLNTTVDALSAEKAALGEKCVLSETDKITAVHDLEIVKREKDELAGKLASMEEQRNALHAAVERVSGDLQAKTDELHVAKLALAALEVELSNFKEAASVPVDHTKKDELQAAVQKLHDEKVALEAKIAETISAAEPTGAADVVALQETLEKNAVLVSQHADLKLQHDELNAKQMAMQDELAAYKEASAAAAAASDSTRAELGQVQQRLADALCHTDAVEVHNKSLSLSLGEANRQAAEMRSAYNTAEAEMMALRDQMAKMRAKLAGVASSAASGTSRKSSTKKNKDEVVIVRNPGDRGRFQVVRRSELGSSRSPSKSSRSRRADYDST